MNWLCKIGVHRPLKNHHHSFIDKVSGKTVYRAKCSCGGEWLVDSPFGYSGSKVNRQLPTDGSVIRREA